ncbi:MAG: TIGR02266 family protein [Polyangiaceae bacterium]
MSNPATIHEEVHLCARCKAIIESEGKEEAPKDDSGVHRVENLVPPEAETPPVPIEPPTKTLVVPIEAAQLTPSQSANLRAAPRKKLEVNVGIQSDSHFFAGLSGDVSKGGLFVATYAEIPIGGKVTLDFELPNGPIVVEGTVRWQRIATDNAGPGLGIQFEGVAKDQLKLIERFCQARPPLYYDQADDDF